MQTKQLCLVILCLFVLAQAFCLVRLCLSALALKLCLVRLCLSVVALKIGLICVDYAGEDHNDCLLSLIQQPSVPQPPPSYHAINKKLLHEGARNVAGIWNFVRILQIFGREIIKIGAISEFWRHCSFWRQIFGREILKFGAIFEFWRHSSFWR